jgi:hypothetical protein
VKHGHQIFARAQKSYFSVSDKTVIHYAWSMTSLFFLGDELGMEYYFKLIYGRMTVCRAYLCMYRTSYCSDEVTVTPMSCERMRHWQLLAMLFPVDCGTE